MKYSNNQIILLLNWLQCSYLLAVTLLALLNLNFFSTHKLLILFYYNKCLKRMDRLQQKKKKTIMYRSIPDLFA